MKNLTLLISAIIFTIGLQAQVNFQNNTVTGTNASSLGENNESSGLQSFSSGKSCVSSGNQSVAMGFNSEANNFTATSIGAYNNASGAMSIAMGSRCNTQATGTVAIGNRLSANATYSFVIGNGITDYNLENNINHSLMIGFDSNIPTFFVGPGNGNYNSLGRIGIGTTSPSKLLDVAGTMNVDNDVTFGSDLDISGGLNVNNASTFANNLDVTGKIAASQLQVTQGASDGKILQSDANGNASWVDPASINDGDWTVNSFNDNVYRMNGNVGIGTNLSQNPNGYRLAVNGIIGAKEVYVENTSSTWPDYVFDDDYDLRSIKKLEEFINNNGHLPGVPTAEEVNVNGLKLAEMNALLLKKVEELTLYLIDLKKDNEILQKRVGEIECKITVNR